MKMKKKDNAEEVSSVKIAFWYLVGDLLVKGLSVITTPIFTRLLTKEEYGNFSNFTSWESILLIFVTLDLSTSITRAKYDYSEKMDEYISSITAVSTFMTLLLYTVVEMNESFFVDLFSMDIFYIRVLFVYFLFEPVYTYMQTKYRIYKKYKLFLLFSLSTAILRTCLSIILVYLMEDNFKARVYGYIIPVLFLYAGIYIYVWFKGKKIKWEYCKYALAIGVPLIPHTLAANILSSSDRVMIQKICGPEQTALYTISYTIAALVNLVSISLGKAWTPWLFDGIAAGKNDVIKEKSKKYVDVFIIVMVGAMLAAPEIVLILGGSEYYEARYIIPAVMSGLVCRFVYTLYVDVETFYKKTFSISVGTMMAAILNIVLNLLFIPNFGYMAAAYTTLIGYLSMLIFHFVNVKYIMHKSEYYDNKNFFIKVAIFILLQFVCTALYANDIIRYAVAVVYAIVFVYYAWKNRGFVKEIIAKK